MKKTKIENQIQANENLTTGAKTRRGFIATTGLLALGFVTRAFSRGYSYDGGLALLEDKKAPARVNTIIPPGSDNYRNFSNRCTGCQQCVSACPNQVLRPSSEIENFMQPYMSFERGYCRPECVKCSQVCPSGAIRPITTAEKSATQIGIAVWHSELCVVNTDDVSCDLCARKCPTAAITMVSLNSDASSRNIPVIDTNRCIGCGACEQLCPSRPYSAIYVEGIDRHRIV